MQVSWLLDKCTSLWILGWEFLNLTEVLRIWRKVRRKLMRHHVTETYTVHLRSPRVLNWSSFLHWDIRDALHWFSTLTHVQVWLLFPFGLILFVTCKVFTMGSTWTGSFPCFHFALPLVTFFFLELVTSMAVDVRAIPCSFDCAWLHQTTSTRITRQCSSKSRTSTTTLPSSTGLPTRPRLRKRMTGISPRKSYRSTLVLPSVSSFWLHMHVLMCWRLVPFFFFSLVTFHLVVLKAFVAFRLESHFCKASFPIPRCFFRDACWCLKRSPARTQHHPSFLFVLLFTCSFSLWRVLTTGISFLCFSFVLLGCVIWAGVTMDVFSWTLWELAKRLLFAPIWRALKSFQWKNICLSVRPLKKKTVLRELLSYLF